MAKANHDYKALLSRAVKELPEGLSSGERFEVPPVEIIYEGRTTIIRNFSDILGKIRRDSDHVLPYLLRELGTAGEQVSERVVLQGKITEKQIQDRIEAYVETYVRCKECGRPDTKLEKDARTWLVHCEACGASHSITYRKPKVSQEQAAAIEEGKTYDLSINDMGQRGDGVARVAKFTVYVPGAQRGTKVKVFIEKVSGTIAFGKMVK
ncbi:MAG: translation initiation factor IF-2 subunit beta [Thermoplasmata archaeon HGW-Thermoplasmata-1]|nr:MAG: translation initiation factor IF-2 subunit beta [Thermoplasmata archaeon HGW-Thermoplasmata-1]